MNNTKQIIVVALIAALVSALVSFVGVRLVGDQLTLGGTGITRFPHSGTAVRYITVTSTPSQVTSGTDGMITALGITTDGANSFSSSSVFAGSVTNSATTSFTGSFKPDSIGAGIKTVTGNSVTTTLTAADVCDYSIIMWTPSTATSSIVLPAAATLTADCMGYPGAYRDVYFRNLHTTSSIMFSHGASTTMKMASSTSATSTLPGSGTEVIRFNTLSTEQTSSNMVELYLINGGL